ncbi:MAG: hypothetical protein M1338_01445, partial [Patescibacteria group bacterium]|nr:hypothetical protein [Patescibacteria group bacterium]
ERVVEKFLVYRSWFGLFSIFNPRGGPRDWLLATGNYPLIDIQVKYGTILLFFKNKIRRADEKRKEVLVMAKCVTGELYEKITGQLFEIGRQLRQKNGYPFNPEELKWHLQAAIEGRFTNNQTDCVYQVVVNYDQIVEEAIKACGLDWYDDNVNSKNFSTTRSGNVELSIELVHFDKGMSTRQVLTELSKRGLRPVEFYELLALSAKFPDLQREFPIVGLGSVRQDPIGGRFCPYLDGGSAERTLDLYWISSNWFDCSRFAAVRK